MGFAYLPERSVVAVRGADAVPFLQGLVSNDVTGIAPGEARWAALLTPQGKWLADFFVLAAPDGLLLDCEGPQAPMLVRLLSRYRLRAKVAVEDASASFAVHAGWGEGAEASVRAAAGIAARDPRHPAAGWRLLLPAPAAPDGTAAYDLHR
ncbi:MAG: YgfZ/GcvT domain-containing protein, partial [Acetobacteraceae bacterium]